MMYRNIQRQLMKPSKWWRI